MITITPRTPPSLVGLPYKWYFYIIIAGVLQGDMFVPFLFIICQDYVLRMLIYQMKENGFKWKKSRSKQYSKETIIDADYVDDLNTPAQVKSLLPSLEQATRGIGLYENSDKTRFMCFNKDGAISSLNGKPLKFVDQFIYLSSNISSTESNVNICIGKVRTAIDRLLIIWKSDLSDKIKLEFFQTVAMSVQLYGSTIWTVWRKS